jgi:arginine exporter protein ArgO
MERKMNAQNYFDLKSILTKDIETKKRERMIFVIVYAIFSMMLMIAGGTAIKVIPTLVPQSSSLMNHIGIGLLCIATISLLFSSVLFRYLYVKTSKYDEKIKELDKYYLQGNIDFDEAAKLLDLLPKNK